MKYGSLCSGIEAATQAWQPLGWSPAFFSEIEKFPSAVLSHHYGSNMPGETHSGNGVPNYGDMTQFERWPDHAIDVLVGGTPCQSFSVAGLRQGLNDPRGNLMLTFGAIAQRNRPKWFVWENVPGVLSSNGGRDFGTFIRLMGECGYGVAYRVLDAQYCRTDGFGRAIPQRRRRVFVVGCLGDWRRAAAVLFEPESLSGNSTPRRKTGESVAAGSGNGVDAKGHRMTAFGQYEDDQTASTIKQRDHKDATDLVTIIDRAAFNQGQNAQYEPEISQNPAIPALVARGPHAVAFQQNASGEVRQNENVSYTLNTNSNASGRNTPMIAQHGPIGLDEEQNATDGFFGTLKARSLGGGFEGAVMQNYAVRRLTPIECERLQGFPDGFTQIPWRKKSIEDCPDGPRYKALGNSMAVNCMRWIGQRIEMIEELAKETA